MNGGIIQITQTFRGTFTKKEAEEYVGGPDYFAELVKEFNIVPCRELRTRIRYRVKTIDKALKHAEQAIHARRNG